MTEERHIKKAAKIMANDVLRAYLLSELETLDNYTLHTLVRWPLAVSKSMAAKSRMGQKYKNVFAYLYGKIDAVKKEYSFLSPIGTLTVAAQGGAIISVSIGGRSADGGEPQDPLLADAAHQFGDYFGGRRKRFDLPLAPAGTDFQKRVWSVLTAIPYGETRTYGQIAAAVGNPKAARAVGMANNKNPLMIIVPCHRVTGADGSLTGYAGGLGAKEFLLELESASRHTE